MHLSTTRPRRAGTGLRGGLPQRKCLTRGLGPVGLSQTPKQQRYGLRNSEIPGLRARESSESTYGRHPNPYHCLPRPSRWSGDLCLYCHLEGSFYHGFDRAARNRATVFWAFLLKRPSRKVLVSGWCIPVGMQGKRPFGFLPSPPLFAWALPPVP